MASRTDSPPLWTWLIGPGLFASALVGLWIVRQDPRWLFWAFVGGSLVAVIAWVFVSALSPSKADKRCPACQRDTVVRLDPQTTRGLKCMRCGWLDETRSSFYLAEEEGPLEGMVLRERANRRRKGAPSGTDG